MLEIKVDFSELNAFAGKLEQAGSIVQRELRNAHEKSLIVLQDAIEGNTPVNIGNLRQSIDHVIAGTPFSLYGEVFTDSIYGLPVEHGRKPGKQPPTSALEAWVIRKLGVDGAEARNVANLVARAIGRRGTQGAHMFQKGFDATQDTIIAIHSQVPAAILGQLA